MTDITALTNALNFLTEQEDYVKVRDQVRVMADMPNTAFVDDFVALNPLLVYARERGGAAALAPLLRVADQAVGEETADKLRRRHYQHGYMRVRRARENKAARAKWLTLPEHVRAKHPKGLRGAVRKDFISYVNARWQALTTATSPSTVTGGRLTASSTAPWTATGSPPRRSWATTSCPSRPSIEVHHALVLHRAYVLRAMPQTVLPHPCGQGRDRA